MSEANRTNLAQAYKYTNMALRHLQADSKDNASHEWELPFMVALEGLAKASAFIPDLQSIDKMEKQAKFEEEAVLIAA